MKSNLTHKIFGLYDVIDDVVIKICFRMMKMRVSRRKKKKRRREPGRRQTRHLESMCLLNWLLCITVHFNMASSTYFSF